MHVTDPLVEVIRLAIRRAIGSKVPIQFITGHTHVRAWSKLDDHAASFEAGRYLDTLGFCSFPTKKEVIATRMEQNSMYNITDVTSSEYISAEPSRFEHVFLEADRSSLQTMLSSDEGFTTFTKSSQGLRLTDSIHATQEKLNLNSVVGCSPQRYYLEEPLNSKSSLWRLYMEEVAPNVLQRSPELKSATGMSDEPLFVQGTGALRYDLFQGTVVLDDIISVCPFNDTIFLVGKVQGWQLLAGLNMSALEAIDGNKNASTLPRWAFSSVDFNLNQSYYLLTSQFHLNEMVGLVENYLGYPLPDPNPFIRHPTGDDNSDLRFWTTTDMWKAYIEREWKCKTSGQSGNSSRQNATDGAALAKEEKPLTVAVFIVLIVCGLYIYQKRKEHLERAGYIPIGDPTTTLIRTSSTLTYR